MPLFDQPFKAFSDPTRRAILRALRDRPLNAGQLAEKLDVAPNTLSFHLRILRDADLIDSERNGQFIRYSLNTSVIDDLVQFFLGHFATRRSAAARKKTRGAGDPAEKKEPSS